MDIARPASAQPIPKSAKKVFSGILFDVYQWEQEQYDGTKRIFEKIKRRDTVGIIPVTTDNTILLLDQEQPGTVSFIGMPGGIIDPGENIVTAAKRELLEETGFVSEEWFLFDSIQPTSKIDWAIYTFVARNCKKIQDSHVDSGEKILLREVSWEEFLQEITKEEFRDRELALFILRSQKDQELWQKVHKKVFGS